MDATADAIATELLAAEAGATLLEPISSSCADFDLPAAYAVLACISRRRTAEGWNAVGRKIGFTNRTIWPIYGVDAPMWAPMWDRTVLDASDNNATVSLDAFVQPRIEPEVVVKLSAPVRVTDDPVAVLESVEWIAAGFEIVHCHYPDWKFALPDCTASFGLHGALVVGPAVPIDPAATRELAATLATFEATLSRDGEVVDTGVGANVLDSPALAVSHLAAVLASQTLFPPLAAGELVTTGTITNAWPIAPGEAWTSDYGALGLPGLTVAFC